MTHSLLQARGLTVRYGGLLALDRVDVHLAPGEAVALVGLNGAGKSTLLRALAGLQAATGEVVLRAGVGTGPRSRGLVAYVPQRSTARWDFPVSVLDAVLTGRQAFRRRGRRWSSQDRQAAHTALARMGMADLAGRRVGSLSGGQAQRVLLARALAQQPQVLLLDEPLAGLDAGARADVAGVVLQLQDDGLAVLCALHELDVARAAFARTVALRGGRVVGDGPSSDVLGPAGLERLLLSAAA